VRQLHWVDPALAFLKETVEARTGTLDGVDEPTEFVHEPNEFVDETDEFVHEPKEFVDETDEDVDETDEFVHESKEFVDETEDFVHETDELVDETLEFVHGQKEFVAALLVDVYGTDQSVYETLAPGAQAQGGNHGVFNAAAPQPRQGSAPRLPGLWGRKRGESGRVRKWDTGAPERTGDTEETPESLRRHQRQVFSRRPAGRAMIGSSRRKRPSSLAKSCAVA
jgi:hypothetical protein